MQTLICYTGQSRRYERWIEEGQPDDPDQLPFRMPTVAKRGDRYLIFVGGHIAAFVGYGRLTSDWRTGRSGTWKGKARIFVTESKLLQPVSGADVEAVTGIPAPRRSCVVDPVVSASLWRAAKGRPLSSVERAVEGTSTEARSKQRNAALRHAAIARANGTCAGCRIDFRQVAGGLGARCLVVHHKRQLRDVDEPEETKITDLAVLCANCHMLIHANPQKALTVAALRLRLKRGTSNTRSSAEDSAHRSPALSKPVQRQSRRSADLRRAVSGAEGN